MKKCKTCGKKPAQKGRNVCGSCIWASRSPEYKKRISRKKHLRRKYDMSVQEYEAMEQKQAGLCAICSADEKLHVDHSHETGEIRGLLCRSCNLGLGFFKDNINNLTKAKQYLVQG